MRFEAHIEKSKLALDTPESWKRYLSGFNEGAKLVLDIDKKTNVRSRSQNSYYWFYLGVIETETGNSASDLHELFKRKFLQPINKKILGTDIKLPASTTDLSKHDFSEYLEKICAESGVPIPDPALAGFTSNHQTMEKVDKISYPKEEWCESTI